MPTGDTPPPSPVPSPSIDLADESRGSVKRPAVIVMDDLSSTEAAWKSRALEVASKRAKAFRLKQPWESSHFNAVFGSTDMFQGTIAAGSSGMLLPTQVGLQDVLHTCIGTTVQSDVSGLRCVVPTSDLKFSRRELPDEEVRRAALDRLRSLLVWDTGATRLGLSLQKIADRTSSPELIDQSVRDCFRAKASSTLQKRASSLWRLSKLLLEVGANSPLQFSEEQLYACLCILRDTGAGATSAQHILEALWFIEGTAKYVSMNLSLVVSGRCKGVARDLYLKKDPLQQKQPLKVEHVRALEQLMRSLNAIDRCILGQLLFCIHACCRWKDSQRVKRISLEEGEGETLVYCEALSSKTSLTAESQTRFLPYVALGSGVSLCDWASLWVSSREYLGLECNEHCLPSYSERECGWVEAPMSSSEATCYMRDFLMEAGMEREELSKFGSHSCKSTLLTWVGRSTIVQFTPTERRQLGHHMKPGTKWILTYSREADTTLYGKVLAMFKTLRDGAFNPDLPAVARVIQTANDLCADSSVVVGEHQAEEGGESDSDSSHGSELDVGTVGALNVRGDFHRVEFSMIPASSLVAHRISGVVHTANEDSYLLCGRRPSRNFSSYGDCEADHPNLDVCRQCLRALKGRSEAD